jgi:integrase
LWTKCGLIIYICAMATLKYFIQTAKNPAKIYIRLRDGRKIDAKAKTNFVINPTDWNDTKGQPKNLKDANLKKLNEDLIRLSADLLSHYNQSNGTQEINSDWLRDFINPKVIETIPTKLVDYFDYYAMHKKSELENSTFTKLNVNKHLLQRFQKEAKKEYSIHEVDAKFKLDFERYCLENNYAPNTIARTIRFIKTICYHAKSNGLETSYQLDNIKVKFEKVDKIYLTKEELQLIESAELEHDYLDNARDWLLISCETGQRVSDFMRFKKEQIRFEGDVPLIEFTQVKTDKIMAIPLSKKVRAILEKRNGEFPRQISDQRYNEYIKEVCKIAGLDEVIKGSKQDTITKRKVKGSFPKYELVTSHIGRRSFATNNYGRIPTPLLMNVTGHTTEGMFLEYIGKTQTDKSIHLAQYF